MRPVIFGTFIALLCHSNRRAENPRSLIVLLSEQEMVIPVVKHFLEKPEKRFPLATSGMDYHRGETR
jgi:hypothetical protein